MLVKVVSLSYNLFSLYQQVSFFSNLLDTVQHGRTPPDLPASLPRRASNLTVDVTIRNVIVTMIIINYYTHYIIIIRDVPPWLSCAPAVSSTAVWSTVITQQMAEHAMVLAVSIKVSKVICKLSEIFET